MSTGHAYKCAAPATAASLAAFLFAGGNKEKLKKRGPACYSQASSLICKAYLPHLMKKNLRFRTQRREAGMVFEEKSSGEWKINK